MSKTLYIIRGVSGSGKSTLAEAIRRKTKSTFRWEADMWMEDDNGEYKFDPNKLSYAHQKCNQEVCRDMERGYETVIVSNTFIKKWEADMYYMLAKLWGYRVVVHRMNNSYDNVHGVPQSKVDIMRSNMEPYPDEIWIGGNNASN